MIKNKHEIRDPIHIFIRLDSSERKVLDSRPFQRLRHIHQLAMTYLVYPGATHRRFEHSLGVLELSTRIFDTINNPNNIYDDSVRRVLPPEDYYQYWRKVLRMAALCHDLGHLPFSHAAERELLPVGWDHERLTAEIILCEELKSIWDDMKIKPEDAAKIAVGPDNYRKSPFSDLENILSEIISGDALGADRMDYLLRDSHHAGVAYGKFDYYRLIDTLRLLPREVDESKEPVLGMEEGGLHSAEALLIARYFMFTQLYMHPVRRAFDIHLKDFLFDWLDGGRFSTEIENHLKITDNEVTMAILEAERDEGKPGHIHADRIVNRKHFRVLYERDPKDPPESADRIYEAACERFGEENIKKDVPPLQVGSRPDFPVLRRDDSIRSSMELSDIFSNGIPPVAIEYVFISPEHLESAKEWLEKEKSGIIELKEEG
ncbi:MAG: HD domain-containing protein [bacterium]